MTSVFRLGLGAQTSLMQAQLSDIRQRIRTVEQQSITGLKLIDPSDMPNALGEVDALEASIKDQGQWQNNASFAISVQNTADGVLGEVSDLLARARELAVLGANEAGVGTERAQLAEEVAQIRESLISTANTQFGDRYIFGGQAYGRPPFGDDGTWMGDNTTATVRIGPNNFTEAGWNGEAIFAGSGSPLDALADLEAALSSDDADAVAATLTQLDGAIDQVISSRAGIGLSTARAESAATVAQNLELALEERKAALVEADQFETYTELANLRVAFEGALQVTASTVRTNLFNLL